MSGLIEALVRRGYKVSIDRTVSDGREHWHIELRDRHGNTSNYNGPTLKRALRNAQGAE